MWKQESVQKLGAKFQIKDKTKFNTSMVLLTHNEDYLGQTGKGIIERSADHCSKDKQSHLLRHLFNNNHKKVDLKDFKNNWL